MRVCFLFILLSLCKVSLAQRVGINTESPTSTLDVNGDVRIRTITNSTNNNDVPLAVDRNGVIKKKTSATNNQALFRGALSRDYVSTTSAITTINNFIVLANPNNNFNTTTNLFTAPVTGWYRVTITVAFLNTVTTNTVLYVGLVSSLSNNWVTRFSTPKDLLSVSASVSTFTYASIVSLTANQTYYFGMAGPGTITFTQPSTVNQVVTFFEISSV